MNKYLPPLDICCEEACIQIYVYNNNTLHFKLKCPQHGIKGIPSPFAKSRLNYEIITSKKSVEYRKDRDDAYQINFTEVD